MVEKKALRLLLDYLNAYIPAREHAAFLVASVTAEGQVRETVALPNLQATGFALSQNSELDVPEGRALFLTTNHPERLDPALVRPGRADVHVELGPVGAVTAERLFRRFFPERPEFARRFAAALGDDRVAPAALQGWLMQHAGDPAGAATAHGLVMAKSLVAE